MIDLSCRESVMAAQWGTRESCIATLTRSAALTGFTASFLDKEGARIRCQCRKSGKPKGFQKATSKTGCEFRINVNFAGGSWHVTKAVLEHNHALIPSPVIGLTADQIAVISDVRATSSSNISVINFVERHFGLKVSQADIETLFSQKFQEGTDATIVMTETEALSLQVTSAGGVFLDHQTDTASGPVRDAIFCASPAQLATARKFGDLVFLDSTTIPNRNGWGVIIVTLIGPDRQLLHGGTFYVAYETKEVWMWIIENLKTITNSMLRTLMADEDQSTYWAYVALIEQGKLVGVGYRVCVWHKANRLVKACDGAGVPRQIRDAIMNDFQIIVYSKSRDAVAAALSHILSMAPQLEQLRQRLHLFTEAYRNSVFTSDFRGSSCAESAHAMVKARLPGGLLKLTVIDETIDKSFQLKEMSQAAVREHGLKEIGAREYFDFSVSPYVQAELEIRSREARHCIYGGPLPGGIHVVKKGPHCFQITQAGCACDDRSRTGFPCEHEVFLAEYAGLDFPKQLVLRRWLENQPEIEVGDATLLSIFDQLEIAAGLEDTPASSDGEQEADPIQAQEANGDEGQDESVFPETGIPIDSSKQFYNEMFTIGKQLASVAAHLPPEQRQEARQAALELLYRLRAQLTDVGDAIAHRGGRPKKGFSKQTPEQVVCILCERPHTLSQCPGYELFLLEKANYDLAKPDGKRACQLCGSKGHLKKNCPVVAATRKAMKGK
jgi:hypothetical protein